MSTAVYNTSTSVLLQIHEGTPILADGESMGSIPHTPVWPISPIKGELLIYRDGKLVWEDRRTLADHRAAQWSLIKQARTQAEHAGFTWDGSTFDSDTTSQNRITGAVQLAQLNPAFSIAWTLQDNTVRQLSAADMTAVGVALGTHVATQFAKAQTLRNQIDAAMTREQVEAVVWLLAP